MPRLAVIEGDHEVTLCELRPDITTIGSGYNVTIHVPGAKVSERHCVIMIDKDGQFGIVDQGSDTGTFVNGKRVEQALLHQGDTITVGEHRLVYIARTERKGVPHPTLGTFDHEKTAGGFFSGDDQRMWALALEGREIEIKDTDCIIGSDETCDIVLQGWGISPSHAVILKESYGLSILNVSDKKKIRINGTKMGMRQSITAGDKIKIGKYTMEVEVAG